MRVAYAFEEAGDGPLVRIRVQGASPAGSTAWPRL